MPRSSWHASLADPPVTEGDLRSRYCARTFNRLKEGAVPRFYDRDRNEEVPEPLYAAFTYRAPLVPSHPVFADTAKGDHVGASPACASFLFIKTTANRVIMYRIVGDT